MNGLCMGDEKVNIVVDYIDDNITSGQKSWSSQKIQNKLDAKADNTTADSLRNSMRSLESTLAGKVNKSELGTQCTYSLSNSTLIIRDK